MGRNEIFALNRTGARLWELLSEGSTRSDAIEQISAEFDVNQEMVEEEASRLLTMLEHERLVEVEET